MDADSPFKFLGCCFEYLKLKEFQGDPKDFLSRIPVALDGTCSGLQHFSALLRDFRGESSVNLVPSHKPSDIYLEVAQEVRRSIEAEGETWTSRVWEDLVDRGACKRGTMTQPYSVTQRGMGDQLFDLIKTDQKYKVVFDRCTFEAARVRDGISDEAWIEYEHKPSAARACGWFAKHLSKAINKVVIASNNGKNFIAGIASLYSKAGLEFNWVTPMGMEIQQTYLKPKVVRVKTFFGKQSVRCTIPSSCDKNTPLNTRKTVSGSSPNFIHSLDATHLMMTVLNCYDRGDIKDFALIHDSFGVHAGHTYALNQALRTTFKELYTSFDILGDLRAKALEDLPEEFHKDIPEIPEMGTLDLDMIKHATYIFS